MKFCSFDVAGSAVLLKTSNCDIHLFRSVEFIISGIRVLVVLTQHFSPKQNKDHAAYSSYFHLFISESRTRLFWPQRCRTFLWVTVREVWPSAAKVLRSGTNIFFFCLLVYLPYTQISYRQGFWCTGTAHYRWKQGTVCFLAAQPSSHCSEENTSLGGSKAIGDHAKKQQTQEICGESYSKLLQPHAGSGITPALCSSTCHVSILSCYDLSLQLCPCTCAPDTLTHASSDKQHISVVIYSWLGSDFLTSPSIILQCCWL